MSATEAFAHALAGSTGGVVAMIILYPLDNIRTRLQVQINKKKELASRRVSQITPVTTDVHHVATPHTSTPSSTSLLRAPLARAPSPQPQPHIPSPTEAIQTIRRNSMDEPIYDNKETHLDQAEIVYHFKGSWDCFRQVIAREGWTKLYTGLNSALIGVGASSAVYFFWYYLFKRMALARSGRKSLGPIENLGIASIAGIVNVFMTLPIWVVNTRMTLTKKEDNYQSVWDATQKIVKAEGISGLYKGLIPSLILVSNPAIQFVAYEQMIRIIRRARHIAATDAAATAHGTSVAADTAANALHLSSLEYFLLGAIAKAIATVATYPYQVVKSRQQAHRTKHIGTWEIIQSIIKVEGYRAFYSGMGAKMSQTVLNSAFMFAVYEKLVRLILDLMSYAVKKQVVAVKS